MPCESVVQVDVPAGAAQPYPIFIGEGNLGSLGLRLREYVRTRPAAVITDTNVGPLYADVALDSLRAADFEPSLVTVPAGEQSKSLAWVSRLYDELARARLDRGCALVALGGGVVGDLTGFVAATWLRGVPVVQCPTTLEADVDSSVGGKTGVNHASGKNMIGAFHQPLFVLIDIRTLGTLSPRDFRAGLAESIKHAVIRDAAFFDWQERNAVDILTGSPEILCKLIEHNVRIKADVVARDERETTGLRAVLNFGHTVGHAVEAAMARPRADGPAEGWRHGECVAVGMVAACEMSVAAGRLDRQSAERVIGLIEQMGLPVQVPLAHAREELLTLMQADKKVAAGRIRFVLADAIGQAAMYDQVDAACVAAGLDRVLR